MRFQGRVKKDGRFWLVEIPAFDAVTQGRTKREALEMAKDLIETMADTRRFEVTVYSSGRGETFEVGANSTGILLALLLRRQRERQGLTLAEAAERLGQRSRNAYARYEQGKAMPTVEKLEQLLKAIAPDQEIVWHFAA
jgi:predicted RNase H-like HicB family nuclease